MMSAASSGGVLSSVDLIASMIWPTGLLERAPHLLGGEDDRLRQAGEHVAAAHLGLHLLAQVEGGADLELDLLGGLLADRAACTPLDVADDRLVHLVAADAQGLRDDDAAERDHGDLGRAAADVDDHVPGRLGDRQAGADRGGHRLLDQVGLARAGGERRLLDRALLDAGDAGGDADDDARVREAVLVHLLDEVAEHLLGDVEVGDDAVLQRADRGDRPRRAAEHALGLDADGVHLAGALVDRDHGRLGEHDAAAAHVDERVRGAEVDGHVAAAEAGEVAAETHRGRTSLASRTELPLARSAEAVDAGETLGEQPDEQRGREADDVQVVALDPLDERGAEALDRVGAGAALPLAGSRRSARGRAASSGRKVTRVDLVVRPPPSRA